MSSKKKKDSKSVALESTKSVSERLTELEATVKSITEDFGVMTRRHDMSTETFDARTRQLLAWANEITEAAKGGGGAAACAGPAATEAEQAEVRAAPLPAGATARVSESAAAPRAGGALGLLCAYSDSEDEDDGGE